MSSHRGREKVETAPRVYGERMFLHVVIVLRTHIHAWDEGTKTQAHASAHTRIKS